MHAFLIGGGDRDSREKEIASKIAAWRISVFDVIELGAIEGTAITIASVRDFQKRLTLRPYNSPKSVGIIRNAHTLTPDAQHALLKTVEEPPPHAHIIIETENPSVLLPTILSRCQYTDLGSRHVLTESVESETKQFLSDLRTSSPGARLKLLESKIKTRDEATAFMDDAIVLMREIILSLILKKGKPEANFTSPNDASELIRRLLTARNQLASNVNFRHVTDSVFLP
jgi:hypothetical protein